MMHVGMLLLLLLPVASRSLLHKKTGTNVFKLYNLTEILMLVLFTGKVRKDKEYWATTARLDLMMWFGGLLPHIKDGFGYGGVRAAFCSAGLDNNFALGLPPKARGKQGCH